MGRYMTKAALSKPSETVLGSRHWETAGMAIGFAKMGLRKTLLATEYTQA